MHDNKFRNTVDLGVLKIFKEIQDLARYLKTQYTVKYLIKNEDIVIPRCSLTLPRIV